ncbi:heterokaryon incompatibility protein-domain-containing protein [Echria macrotheca]|uniref:Heterokaryon incompatibility protein-domain-containing protein n=1 Tax=Echria macrotheca TaxID=438768 RepID=A0AAJ0BKR8_9PEZI|nr:heterokaryon incompatibility protein-domain-containing protein [Echria macrotheca]
MADLSGIDRIYRQLPSSRSVRLLRIHGRAQRPGICDPVIAVSLDMVDLDTAPPFDALSYTWGSAVCEELGPSLLLPTKKRQNVLSCEDTIIPIRPNLHDALDMLLDTYDETRADFIWIDALCINQDDKNERASQVRIMDELYMRAASVIVWLGQDDRTTPAALATLEKLAVLGRDAVPCSLDDQDRAQASVSHIGIDDLLNQAVHTSKLGIEPITLSAWISLIAFFSRPYFSRVWVIQEVTLARRIVAICGRRVINWESIVAASFCVLYTGWQHYLSKGSVMELVHGTGEAAVFKQFLADDRACNGSTRLLSLVGCYQLFRMPLEIEFSETQPFQDAPRERQVLALLFELIQYATSLLLDARGSGASDPRDNVFALIGMVHAKSHHDDVFHRDECRFSRLVDISYDHPTNFVYTQITRNILRVQRNLAVLESRETTSERSIEGLPSWVPDFSIGQTPARFHVTGHCASSGLGKPPFPHTPQTNEDYFLLSVRGLCVGKVVDKDRTLEWESPGRQFDEICRVAMNLPFSYPLQQPAILGHPRPTSRAEVVARTCIANGWVDHHEELDDDVTELASHFLHHLAGCISATRSEDIRRDPSLLSRAVSRTKLALSRTKGLTKQRRHIWQLIGEEPSNSAFSPGALTEALSCFRDQPGLQAVNHNGPGPHAKYRGAAAYVTRQRRVFRTDTGLLGLGPEDLKEGDEAWVLAGMSTVAMLRRGKAISTSSEEARYEFLGAAYVHGIMHGEAVAEDCIPANIVLV